MTIFHRGLASTLLLLVAACGAGTPPPETAASAPAPPPVAPPTPSAPAKPPKPPAVVLARVGEEAITVEEFRAEMARRGGRLPGQFSTVEQRQALLDEVIQERVALQMARQEGLDQDEEYRSTIARMLTTQYLRAHLDPQLAAIEVTSEEIAAFYEAHREEFLTPERIRAAWIFLAVSAKADAAQVEKTRQRLVAARDEATKLPDSTRNFGEIAKRYSEDAATRYVGGEMGWLYAGQAESYRWGPALVNAAFALPVPGALSEIQRHEKGWYLLKLVEREAAKPAPIEKLAPGIRSRIQKERREAVRASFYAELLAGTRVSIDAARLAAIAPLSSAEPAPAPPTLPKN
ncbi:MAG: peptidylprolyl isomerase [Thermoanaerobaculia bacterium]